MADREDEAFVLVEGAFERRQRGAVSAMRAVVAGDAVPSDHELIDVRRTPVGSPAAAIPVGILGRCRDGKRTQCRRRNGKENPPAHSILPPCSAGGVDRGGG